MFAEKATVILLLHLFAINIQLVTSDTGIDSVTISFFYGPTFNDSQKYNLNDAASLVKHPKFIHNQTTCFMIGYDNLDDNPGTRLMVDSYLKRNTTNFLNINYEKINGGNYSYNQTQKNVLKLASRVVDFCIKLFRSGVNDDTFSLVGHSLGGRGVSLIARGIVKRSIKAFTISRLSMLDPTNEERYDIYTFPPIEQYFAKFIDVIHSAAGFATTKSLGNVNFWPNNGTALQPGCSDKTEKCSHRKSLAYWAESVANGPLNSMLAYPSGSYDNLLKNGEDRYKNGAVVMGIDCPREARGDYYLQYNTTFGDSLTLSEV
ncbi:vitellogenin-1-like [Episyrphus balteatus]|uniref:vitellogenin-1-like n=1 Tax=Episyrphus balteatus TaxID=286459 RepID=UPI002485D4DA|nr:vitellogenin-1-like [Episyrphus balteatus]